MDVTLTVNGRNVAARLSTYEVRKIVEEVRKFTTMNGVEHTLSRIRDEVTFSLIPYDDTTATEDYNAWKTLQFTASYTDPNTGGTATKTVRLVSDIDSVFGLKSINNKRYYKGGKLVLRAVEVNA